jgi:hypothetical protein
MKNIGGLGTYEGPPPLNWRVPILYLWDSIFPYLCNMCTEVDQAKSAPQPWTSTAFGGLP